MAWRIEKRAAARAPASRWAFPIAFGFAIVVGYNLIVTRAFKLAYREAIITTIIGSSSHFEIAIATAVAMYGVGSMAALGTTMGLFWEVPIMLGLVYLGRALGRRGFWAAGGESVAAVGVSAE